MTFGLPVIAPSGTLAVTERLVTATGGVAVLPPPCRVEEDLRDVAQVAAAHLDLGVDRRLVDAAALGDADDV